jgi:hypothetical protein
MPLILRGQGGYRKPGKALWSSRMVTKISPTHSRSSSHTGTLPKDGVREEVSGQRGFTA